MTSRPLVTVIVPTFNRWDLLPDALRSLQAQTYPAWEAVVVNDGGEPPRGEAVPLLDDPRIRYVEHPRNLGLAQARNTAIRLAAGEWIAYLDDDDVYYADHLESAVGALLSERRDVAYTDACRATCEVSGGACRVLRTEDIALPEFDPMALWRGNFIPVLCVVHRRSCLDRTGLFDPGLRILEDWDLWLRMSTHFRFHHVPRVTCQVRVRGDGSNMMDRENRRLDAEVKTQIYRKYLEEAGMTRDPEVEGRLRGGIAWLVRCHRAWFADRLSRPEDGSRFRALYDALPWNEKLRLIATRPLPGLRRAVRGDTGGGRVDDGGKGRTTGPRVTVVMPVRNGERHIEEAIASVLGQTYRDFEFLVIDDGSTDGTPGILDAFEDPRLKRVRHAEGVGVARTLNEGLRLARGEYVARMDADDVSLPGRLEAQVAFMDRHPEVGICGTWIRFIGEGAGTVIRYPADPEEIRCLLLFSNAMAHPSVILRRGMLDRYGISYDPDCLRAQDYDLWVRSSRSFPLANLPRVWLEYRVHPGQVWSVHADEQERFSAQIRKRQLERLGVAPTPEEWSLHEAIGGFRFRADRDFVTGARSWLEKLHAANRRASEYPEPAFSSLLGTRWFQLCCAATRLGRWTWSVYRDAALPGRSAKPRIDTMKFALKCAWKAE